MSFTTNISVNSFKKCIIDILPTDISLKIVYFLITYGPDINRYNVTQSPPYRYRCMLPTLSKAFQMIVFQALKYQVCIYDEAMDKSKDPIIYVLADHYNQMILIKSNQYLHGNKDHYTSNIVKSTLNWHGQSRLSIDGAYHAYKSTDEESTTIIDLLSQIVNNVTISFVKLNYTIPTFRLVQYPKFTDVVILDLRDLSYHNPHHAMNHACKWLNIKRFPSLKILLLDLQEYISSSIINKVINSLELSALYLRNKSDASIPHAPRAGAKLKLKIPAGLQFLCIAPDPYNDISELDLSRCESLVAMQLGADITFSSIKWNVNQTIQLVNVVVYQKRDINSSYSEDWYNAYINNRIPCNILVGQCFFETKGQWKYVNGKEMIFVEEKEQLNAKYKKYRSMCWSEFILEADAVMNCDWRILHAKHYSFVHHIGINSAELYFCAYMRFPVKGTIGYLFKQKN
eukprot:415369_1